MVWNLSFCYLVEWMILTIDEDWIDNKKHKGTMFASLWKPLESFQNAMEFNFILVLGADLFIMPSCMIRIVHQELAYHTQFFSEYDAYTEY